MSWMSQQEKKQGLVGSSNRANRVILSRTRWLMGLLGVVAFAPLFWKLWDVQIMNHQKYEEYAINQQTSDLTVTAPRGTIYDVQGNILAISSTVQNIIISPKEILSGGETARLRAESKLAQGAGLTESEKASKLLTLTDAEQAALAGTYGQFIANGLAEILEMEAETILVRMEKTNSMYEVLQRRVEDYVSIAVNEFISENSLYPGVYLRPDTKRYYPYSSLGAQLIGWVNPNNDNVGAYGLEARYESVLSGVAGRVITAKNAAGTEMLSSYESYIDPEPGNNLHLTIDATIQNYCERVLAEGISSYDVANGGFCIAMDPNTGAILGMVSSPYYDLNDPWDITDDVLSEYVESVKNDPSAAEDAYLKALGDAQLQQWRNKALSDAYEPGSTFKTLVLAAALEEGVVSESDSFYCSGSMPVATWTIRCSNRDGHGMQTLAEAVENSCNPAFIEIGQKLGASKFYDYLEAFGFFDKTGLDNQVEGRAQIWSRESFVSEQGIASLATASFGQTLKVTPIQMITAACATVNGGYLMEPYMVESITNQHGVVLESYEPVVVRQVVSEQTSERVRAILEGVVDGGTGKNAYISGYRIGGKTGTSEKRDETSGDLIVSFLGVAPADNPQVVILLAFDSPTPSYKGGTVTATNFYISGGSMAALSGGALISDILAYMGVEKVYADQIQAEVLVPQSVGLSVLDAKVLLEGKKLSYRIVGEGDIVTDQLPTQGSVVATGTEIVLYMDAEKPVEQVTMPNLVGRSVNETKSTMERLGLYIRGEGMNVSGAVAATQSVPAGTLVDVGAVVDVHYMDTDVQDYAANGNIGQSVT